MHAVGVLDAGEVCVPLQLLGTYKTGKARFWPWLEPFLRETSSKPFVFKTFSLGNGLICQNVFINRF
jgi:hypothetical protein